MPTAKPPHPDVSGGTTQSASQADAVASAPAPVPHIGETIAGKYLVEGILGRGGMGVVLCARHEILGNRVALKLLHSRSADATERILREAQVLAQLTSDHIVRVFDFGKLSHDRPYIVMEHLNGEDLSKVIARGPVSVQDAVRYVLEACEALQEAHARGIVHRDLKPANLFLETRSNGAPRIKVLDFGLSKLLQPMLTHESNENWSLTTTTDVMGSPRYMSPEQAHASKDVDIRADIWSLGVILYELVTARPPFRASSFTDLIIRIATQQPEPMIYAELDTIPELAFVVMHCLSKDRDHRYGTIAELVDALAPLRTPSPQLESAPPPPPSAAREREARGFTVRQRAWLGIGIGVMLLATGALWILSARNSVATDVNAASTAPAAQAEPVRVALDESPTEAEAPPAPTPAESTPKSASEDITPPAPVQPADPVKRRKNPQKSLQIGEILPPSDGQ